MLRGEGEEDIIRIARSQIAVTWYAGRPLRKEEIPGLGLTRVPCLRMGESMIQYQREKMRTLITITSRVSRLGREARADVSD